MESYFLCCIGLKPLIANLIKLDNFIDMAIMTWEILTGLSCSSFPGTVL